jgi:hypothetical protein
LQEEGGFFKKFPKVKDILFVRAGQKIVITTGDNIPLPPPINSE